MGYNGPPPGYPKRKATLKEYLSLSAMVFVFVGAIALFAWANKSETDFQRTVRTRIEVFESGRKVSERLAIGTPKGDRGTFNGITHLEFVDANTGLRATIEVPSQQTLVCTRIQ